MMSPKHFQVGIFQGWGVPYKYGKSMEVGGGGVLGENLSVVGYGYFLEPHNYDLYSVLDNQKAFKTTFHATTVAQKLKDFSRKNGIQGLFKDYS